MKKERQSIKRVLSMVMVIAMVLTMLPAAVFAADTPTTLYLKPNANWTQASAHFAAYFFGNGETWVSMTDSDGDGVYEVTVPDGYTSVIFCRMDPSNTTNGWSAAWNQTNDLTIPTDGTNCYTVADGAWSNGDGTWSTYSPIVSVYDYFVAGSAGLCGVEWDPATNQMTQNTETGLYEITFSNVYAGTYEYKITTGSWDTPSYGNGEGNYSVTVAEDGSTVTITFDVATSTSNATVTAPETEPEVPEVTTYTVYCINSGNWDAVSAYAWTTGGAGLTWPGEEMTKTGETVNGFDVYSVTFDTAYENVIFNNNNNGSQTADLTMNVGQYYDVKSATWYASLDEVPAVDSLATDRYLVGSFNSWNTTTNEFKLEAANTTTGYVSMELAAATTYEFKVVQSGTWTSCATTITDDTSGLAFSSSVSDNAKITTTIAGTYVFAFDVSGSKLSVTYPVAEGGDDNEPEEPAVLDYYLIGNINGADYSGEDYKFVDGSLTVTFTSDSYVVVKDTNGDWYLTESYVTDATGTFIKGKAEKMFVPGNVELTFTLVENEDGSLTLSYEKDESTEPVGPTYIVAGTSALCGSEWAAGDLANLMTYNAESGLYEKVCYNVPAGTQAFKITDGTWDNNWGGAGTDGNYEVAVTESGSSVKITFNASTKAITADVTPSTFYSVAGSEELCGVDWDPAAAANKMSMVGENLYELTYSGVAAGTYEFKVTDGSWSNSWGDGNGNYKITLTETSNVTIAFNANTGEITATVTAAEDKNEVTINVYYDRADGIYSTTIDDAEAKWNAYVWGDGLAGTRYDFAKDANGDMVTTIKVVGRQTQNVYLKTRLSTTAKEWIKEESQVSISLGDIVSGTINVYVKSYGTDGNAGKVLYKSVPAADIVKANKVSDVQLDYETGKITVTTKNALTDPATELTLVKGEETVSCTYSTSGSTYVLTPSVTLDLVTLYQYKVKYDGYTYDIGIDNVYATKKFADAYTYTGTDLGATWRQNYTTFKVWAPTASAVSVNLYTTGSDSEEGAKLFRTFEMVKSANGTWLVNVNGDLDGYYYTYAVTVNGETVEVVDPYARTTGVNGNRGMVVDLDSTDPEGWANDKNPNPITPYTDAVIYELHVRDFSIDDSSGVTEANRGKYLAFTEEGTKTANGVTTGIDYLDELGVTHVHLLPVYDYASVDETKCDTFNWGYDPQNYNTPEGSYSTDPYNGETRVNEFKQMVKSLHDHDISVIMDVVYNHVYNADTFCFNNIVPGYFSRVNSDRSGCGNDTASEREMVRKYIVESVLYWCEEYHIDGFRFDLVGLLDVETINQIVTEVHKVRPDVIFYGEGWDMDDTNREPGTEMAKQGNASKTPGFGYFSDNIRNLLGGNNGKSIGFVSGQTGVEADVVSNFKANPWWTNNPQQVIQYASCHDNYTLIDKLVLSTGASGITNDIISMNNLAAAVYMTAQGVPFIHAGEEFLREKLEEDGGRCENSYNASDYVNHIEWSNLEDETYASNVEYYKGLIAFRAAHPALRYATADAVSANIQSVIPAENVVAFLVDGNAAGDDDICVIFNANSASKTVTLPEGEWNVCIDGDTAGTETLYTAETAVQVEGISAMVLTREDTGVNTDTIQEADANKYQVRPYAYGSGSTEEGKVTVYFSNNKYWTNVYAYAWNDNGNLTAAWPGTAMTKVTTNEFGEDIYSITLDSSATAIIFNNGSGEQTVDITSIVNGQGYYCTSKGGNSSFTNDGEYTASDYYLFGYINGENYGCEENSAAMGEYVFDAKGELTVTFEQDSYVGVKTTGNGAWYMTDGWEGNVTNAWLYDITVRTDISKFDKLMVPGGVEVTFTLSTELEGMVNLSYIAAASDTSYSTNDTSGIQNGVTLHCWNWSFAEIEKNMAAIAEQGYTAIQTSPVQPLKEATNLDTNSVGSHWWVYYQPVDFVITTNEGNALGTKAELESMIETAHEYGIKVIVDVVANHLANAKGNDLSDAIPADIRDNSAYWHDYTTDTTDYTNRTDVTQHCMGGLPDLNTGNDEIQAMVLDFLKECIDIGVDGFRFDAAKHIETPKDDVSSDFWPTVIGGAEEYAQEKGKDIYCYGETLDSLDGLAISAYTEYMAVTDNSWGNTLRENISDGNAIISEGYDKPADKNQLVVWAESHDTYANAEGGSADETEAEIMKTWALVAARADVMGLYLARPESNDQLLGIASETAWANKEVKAVNEFHNAFIGQPECVDAEGEIVYVERGASGVVLVNAKDTSTSVSVPAYRMEDGTYTDQITGNAFTVADGMISGTIGDSGIAVVYNVEDELFDIEFSRINLGNALDMQFAFAQGNMDDWTGTYAVATKVFADGRKNVVETIPADKWEPETINGEEYWYLTFSDISGKEMADNIYVTIYNADGEAISNQYTDSIRDYAMRKLSDEGSALDTMFVDMLNYGAAAQEYYSYGTDDLANAELTDTQKAYASDSMEACTDTRTVGANYKGSRLELKNSINLQLAFDNLTTDMTAEITFTDHHGTSFKHDVTAIQAEDGMIVIDIDQAYVADCRQDITVKVKNADGTVYSEVTDSVASYVARRLGSSITDAESALYETIMKFSDSARVYLNSAE